MQSINILGDNTKDFAAFSEVCNGKVTAVGFRILRTQYNLRLSSSARNSWMVTG